MKQITSRLVGLLFICLISGFAFTNVYAKTMGEKRVRVHGSWDEEKRSVSLHIPEHTRSLSGSLLGYKTIP